MNGNTLLQTVNIRTEAAVFHSKWLKGSLFAESFLQLQVECGGESQGMKGKFY